MLDPDDYAVRAAIMDGDLVPRADYERLRIALLTISTADDPDAPISRATCAAVAKAALNA